MLAIDRQTSSMDVLSDPNSGHTPLLRSGVMETRKAETEQNEESEQLGHGLFDEATAE